MSQTIYFYFKQQTSYIPIQSNPPQNQMTFSSILVCVCVCTYIGWLV